MRVGIVIDGVLRDTLGKIEECYERDFKKPTINSPLTYDLAKHFELDEGQDLQEWIEDYNVDIFGYANLLTDKSMMIFNHLQEKFKGVVEFVLLSREEGRSRAATMFFLSKTGCNASEIRFVDFIENYNNLVDVLVAANPIDFFDFNGISILLETVYNTDLNHVHTIKGLEKLGEQINLILENL